MKKVKFIVEMYPAAFEAMDSICKKTGVSKDEIVEKLFLTYIPFLEERAVELIIDDIVTRTQQLSPQKQKSVFKEIIKYLESELDKMNF